MMHVSESSKLRDDAHDRDDRSTADLILDAAIRILARDGYGGLTARTIAREAGTNVALLNYYFGSKKNLVLAVFDRLDAEKLARQQRMLIESKEPASARWREAINFYRQDLDDGYVRVLQELTAQGFSDPEVAERVQSRIAEWRSLLTSVAEQILPDLGITVSPHLAGSAVASLWLGTEVQHLIGVSEEEASLFEVLDSIGDWLEAHEQQASVDDGTTLRR